MTAWFLRQRLAEASLQPSRYIIGRGFEPPIRQRPSSYRSIVSKAPQTSAYLQPLQPSNQSFQAARAGDASGANRRPSACPSEQGHNSIRTAACTGCRELLRQTMLLNPLIYHAENGNERMTWQKPMSTKPMPRKNCITFRGAGSFEDLPFLLMDYCNGGSAAAQMLRGRKVSAPRSGLLAPGFVRNRSVRFANQEGFPSILAQHPAPSDGREGKPRRAPDYSQSRGQMNILTGSAPSSIRPAISKLCGPASTCCAIVCISRSKRSRALVEKIAAAPARQ